MIDNSSSIETTFIDVIFGFLFAVFMIANFKPTNNSMPMPSTYPIVNIFIYKGDRNDSDYYTVMNGFELSLGELKKNILLAKKQVTIVNGKKKRFIFSVQVIAGIDPDVPFWYVDRINEMVSSLNYVNGKKSKYFLAAWKDYKLTGKEKTGGQNEAKRKKS